jgi:hypothetical protein
LARDERGGSAAVLLPPRDCEVPLLPRVVVALLPDEGADGVRTVGAVGRVVGTITRGGGALRVVGAITRGAGALRGVGTACGVGRVDRLVGLVTRGVRSTGAGAGDVRWPGDRRIGRGASYVGRGVGRGASYVGRGVARGAS